MNRWTKSIFLFFAGGLISLASAQTEEFKPNVRQFATEVRRGELVILTAPEIAMDNKPDRLSPGVRIRDINNNLVLSSALANQKLTVNYLRDNTGLVHSVWVLNPEEIKQKMSGKPEGILGNLRSMFDTPVVKDDGNTPFDKLPKYKQ